MCIRRVFLSSALFLLLGHNSITAACSSSMSSSSMEHEVDYVVIGAGTAGAVLAKELSDDHRSSVCVLHIGKNLSDKPLIKYSKNVPYTVLAGLLGGPIPFDISILPPNLQKGVTRFLNTLAPLSNPLYVSGSSTPQPNADNRELLWVMAKPLGGATSVNAGVWCEGTPQVFSQWEALAGPQWSVNRIYNTFRRLETYKGKSTDLAARGNHGPIHVHQVPSTPISRKFTKAITKATGFPYVLDYNDINTPIGVSSQMQITQRGSHGKYRVSSATAFLNSDVMDPEGFGVDGRKLRVLFKATALKTIWNGNTAVGVEYLQDGELKQVFARKGVVVSAGLYSSQFLLHSGVGPAPLLTSLGIPVIFNNPNVGQGLADQPHVLTFFTSNPNDTPENPETVFSEISWLPTPGGDPTVRTVRFSTIAFVPGLTLGILDLVQPLSRGSITIDSSDPLDPPVINFGELSNPNDLALFQSALINYIKPISQQIHQMDPFYQLIYPDPSTLDDPLALTKFIKEEVGANMHFQSHCRMVAGTSLEDAIKKGGVVDSSGHVYGVKNLIVADDSIAPQCTDGSPMSTAYLIGANIARIMLNK